MLERLVGKKSEKGKDKLVFSQCIFKRIHANGLSQRYRTDEGFALQARMIAALAFVPPDDVVNYFEILEDGAGPFPAELLPVLDYLENT